MKTLFIIITLACLSCSQNKEKSDYMKNMDDATESLNRLRNAKLTKKDSNYILYTDSLRNKDSYSKPKRGWK
jgi:hypothetical protein